MPKYFKNKNTKYVKDFDLVGDFNAIKETENMYIDYDNGGLWLESFPGYRKISSFAGKINGIFDIGLGDKGFIVHAGTELNLCYFLDAYKDALQEELIGYVSDNKSFCYRIGGNAIIFDGSDINMIDQTLKTKNMKKTPDIIYVPTTYVNGVEEEQVNLLTDKFKEECLNIKAADYAYESSGLVFRIKSEAEGTCSVIGIDEGASVKVYIPNRKRINGKYYKVVEVADDAFSGEKNVLEVTLGSGVSRVGKRAFANCKNLKLAVMPDGIVDIDESAFSNCTSLQNVYIGVTCKSIYYNAFEGCLESMNVYFSDTYEHLEKCEGVGNLMMFTVFYSTKYKLNKLAIPVFSPAKSISSLTIDGEETAYTQALDRGFVIISSESIEEFEGKSIVITGRLDTSLARISERGTTFSSFAEGVTDTRAVILSCTDGEGYDGRGFIFGAPGYENIIFMSSFTRDGVANPYYFGDLDFFSVGSAAHPIGDIKKEGERLAVSKPTEDDGSIFLLYPKGEANATFGRRYTLICTLKNTGVRSSLYEFNNSTIFIGKSDICKMKYSSSSATFEPISLRCPESMRKDLNKDMIFSTIGGYLAVITGTKMYLGDRRLTEKVLGADQYKWFTIRDIGGYEGDKREYYYAKSDVTGIYSHPDLGMATSETVYSYIDENGKTIYYVTIGLRKYRVFPGEEVFGGVAVGISFADKYKDTIVFGTEKGELFAFNTDKKGIAPSYMYKSGYFYQTFFEAAYRNKLYPYFYTHAGHRVRYSVTTSTYNGGMAHILKSNVRGALTARLGRRSGAKICFSTSTDRKEVTELGGITMGDFYFWDMNFDDLSFADDSPEIISIPENHEKWAEKQITVYTNQLKAPFAINLISLGFKVDGRISNGQER